MKYHYLLALLFILPIGLKAQQDNVFLDRSFWKTMPDVATVKEKIKQGNDPVALNPFAFDAVTYAILEDAPIKTIQYLLSLEGNPVDKNTHDGRNYLLWAGYKGNLELMKHLIEEGSDTHLIDDHGYNLICFTATGGQQDTEVYDLILASGLDVASTNRSGANALLLLAPSITDTKIISYFTQKGLDIHAKDNDGNGMFNYAARKGNTTLMEQLIEMGVDYKSLNEQGENAIIYASQSSRGYTNPLEIYQYLENLGMEIDIVSWEGKTPLHNLAFSTKDLDIIDYFIKKGVSPNQVDNKGNTAFLNAARGGNTVVAKQLMESVKDINYTNHEGYSALHFSVMRNSDQLFSLLIENGADLTLLDKNEANLLYHIYKAYNSRSDAAFDTFLAAAKRKGLRADKALEEEGTLAHIAVEKNAQLLLEEAVKLGVDINKKNADGLTPLHLAAMKAADKELLTLLLTHGADKHILTDFDESAFELAAENELLANKKIDLKFLKID